MPPQAVGARLAVRSGRAGHAAAEGRGQLMEWFGGGLCCGFPIHDVVTLHEPSRAARQEPGDTSVTRPDARP